MAVNGSRFVRPIKGRRGAVLVYSAIILVVLLGVSALAVDLGVAYLAHSQLQNVADAAALAGADKYREAFDEAAAKQEAISIAAANRVLGDSQTLNPLLDVKAGSYDSATGTVIPYDETMGGFCVQVTARRTRASSNPIPTFFAKVLGINSVDASAGAIARIEIIPSHRDAISAMIVQDGSGSFQNAWSRAIDADTGLITMINTNSTEGDAFGMVTFNAKLDDNSLRNLGLYNSYSQYPGMNEGIKHTTDSSGYPVKTTVQGIASSSGQVRPMIGPLTAFDPSNHSVVPQALSDAGMLMKNGKAWGDTDTAVGLNYAIDQLTNNPSGAKKVIILVSDGMPHDVRGSSYTELRKQAAIAAADRAGAADIKIHTVTLEGTDGANYAFNEGLVRNGGMALRAASADDLKDLLIKIGTPDWGTPRLIK